MTKADFYIGIDKSALWLGSILKDGMPDRIQENIIFSVTGAQYESRVKTMLMKNKNSFLPGGGWPWLWEDSRMTDYSYFFFKEKVYTSFMGDNLFDPIIVKLGGDLKTAYVALNSPKFPNMKGKR